MEEACVDRLKFEKFENKDVRRENRAYVCSDTKITHVLLTHTSMNRLSMVTLLIYTSENVPRWYWIMIAEVKCDDVARFKVFVGPTKSSVFIRDCNNCEFTIACKQLRTRNCHNCKIHLFAGTDPIVETSTNIVMSDSTERIRTSRSISKKSDWIHFRIIGDVSLILLQVQRTNPIGRSVMSTLFGRSRERKIQFP